MPKTYRPVLLAEDIACILSMARKQMNPSKDVQMVIAKLAMFEYKIINGAIRPQYETQTQHDKDLKLAQKYDKKLGFDLESNIIQQSTPKQIEDKKQQKLDAFNKWSYDPDSCSVIELKHAALYRIENGLDEEFNQLDFIAQMLRIEQLGE